MVFLGCVKFLAGWVRASPSQAVFVCAGVAADGDRALRDGGGGLCLCACVASPDTEGIRQGRKPVFSRGAWTCGEETGGAV